MMVIIGHTYFIKPATKAAGLLSTCDLLLPPDIKGLRHYPAKITFVLVSAWVITAFYADC